MWQSIINILRPSLHYALRYDKDSTMNLARAFRLLCIFACCTYFLGGILSGIPGVTPALGQVLVANTPPTTEPPSDCLAAGIASVTLSRVTAFTGAVVDDWCRVASSGRPQTVNDIIMQVKTLNQKVARTFGLTVAELLPSPIKLEIFGNVLGPLMSSAGYERITIGVWEDSNDLSIAPGIYVHELGHILAKSGNSKLPTIYTNLGLTFLVQETIADYLAIAVTGSVIDAELSVTPSCFDRVRYINGFQSYHFPAGYFELDFSGRRLNQCCLSQEGQTVAKRDPHWKNACAIIVKGVPQDPQWHLDRKPLDPYSVDMNKLDPHQIGIPINSFLGSLSRELDIALSDLVVPALWLASDETYQNTYSCAIPLDLDAATTLQQQNFSAFFKALRNSLNIAQKAIYDKLWVRHGLSIAVVLANRDAKDLAKTSAIYALRQKLAECFAKDGNQCNPTCIRAQK